MASTGEVGCLGDDYHESVLKAALSVGMRVPEKSAGKGILVSSGPLRSKVDLLDCARRLHDKGYRLYATEGTYEFLAKNGVPSIRAYQPSEVERDTNLAILGAVELIRENKVDLVINIPKNLTETELSDGYRLRRSAVDHNVTLFTNARLAGAFIDAFCELELSRLPIKSWDEYKV